MQGSMFGKQNDFVLDGRKVFVGFEEFLMEARKKGKKGDRGVPKL
jgi:hypothetical protein